MASAGTRLGLDWPMLPQDPRRDATARSLLVAVPFLSMPPRTRPCSVSPGHSAPPACKQLPGPGHAGGPGSRTRRAQDAPLHLSPPGGVVRLGAPSLNLSTPESHHHPPPHASETATGLAIPEASPFSVVSIPASPTPLPGMVAGGKLGAQGRASRCPGTGVGQTASGVC